MLAGSICITRKKRSSIPVQPSSIVLFNTYIPCIFEVMSGVIKTIRVLILEDDIETLSKLLQCLYLLQKRIVGIDIALTILSEHTQVETYLNKAEKNIFDIILLDRDCKAGGSFHVLDFDKYPVERVVGISSVPPYNEQLKQLGVERIVQKDYKELDVFIHEVEGHLMELLEKV